MRASLLDAKNLFPFYGLTWWEENESIPPTALTHTLEGCGNETNGSDVKSNLLLFKLIFIAWMERSMDEAFAFDCKKRSLSDVRETFA